MSDSKAIKSISFMLAMTVIVCLFIGCQKNDSVVSYGINAEWNHYTEDELIETTDCIYLGEVIKESFMAVDGRRGRRISEETSISGIAIATIYTIRIQRVFKGELSASDEVLLYVKGGRVGNRDEEKTQIELLREAGVPEDQCKIGVLGGAPVFETDRTFLFFTSQGKDFQHIMNPTQTAYVESSDQCTKLIKKLEQ